MFSGLQSQEGAMFALQAAKVFFRCLDAWKILVVFEYLDVWEFGSFFRVLGRQITMGLQLFGCVNGALLGCVRIQWSKIEFLLNSANFSVDFFLSFILTNLAF
ncbi:unnamed protein product [Rhizophagus irregularis]|nr:unnamed protein product [Rhizophagus irregularis]